MTHTGAMVAVYPPPDIAAALALPDGEPAEQIHLTLVFLGEAADVDLDATAAVLAQVAATHPPLNGTIGGYGLFNPTDGSDGSPVTWAGVDLPGLPATRQDLFDALTAAGLAPAAEHGYVPHMTLAYDDRTDGLEVPTTPVVFDELLLVAGDAVHSRHRLTAPAIEHKTTYLTPHQIAAGYAVLAGTD